MKLISGYIKVDKNIVIRTKALITMSFDEFI